MASEHKKQRKLLVGLIVACAVLATAMAYLILDEKTQTTHGLDKSSILHITLKTTGSEVIGLEKQKEREWRITQPVDTEANYNRVEPLLSIATIAPSYSSTEVDRNAAGLDNPIASITFNNQQFYIGDEDVSGKRRYAESNGKVYFFPEWIVPLINGGVDALANASTQ